MKKVIFFILLVILYSCSKNEISYPAVGNNKKENALEVSKERAKNLNAIERTLIEEWIKNQKEVFYTMPLNYWVNIKDLHERPAKSENQTVTYSYELYDFDEKKIYNQPKGFIDIPIKRISEIKAIEDVLKYLNTGEEATLLVPSVLAYGTYGDHDKIANDIPLMIKIKELK